MGVVGGLQALLGVADPGKGFLQTLREFLLSHGQRFQACELEGPQSLAGTTESRKASVPGPSKGSSQPVLCTVRARPTTSMAQGWDLLAGPRTEAARLTPAGLFPGLWRHF